MLKRNNNNNNSRSRHHRITGTLANLARSARQARYNALITRINQTRVQNGENPISPDLLQTILTRGGHDFDPNDYDDLLRLNEEAGPSEDLLANMGASNAEIERCPSRVITSVDDDLIGRRTNDGKLQSCAVCLEAFAIGDQVRTIPCFHTFHNNCIDPWLRKKAECPVCKYSAIG